MSSRPKYRAQPPLFESCMYDASARSRHSRGGSFLTSFYGNHATKFDGLSNIPTIFKFSGEFLRTGLYHATGCKIFRRFRTTALPIVRLNACLISMTVIGIWASFPPKYDKCSIEHE